MTPLVQLRNTDSAVVRPDRRCCLETLQHIMTKSRAGRSRSTIQKTEHSQDHHRRLHFPPSHYLFFFFRSHPQLQTEQTATRGSTSVFSLLRYIRFHFLSLSSFSALLSRLPAKCSNTCKPYKINSRYSRNRNDGCYACLFPQSCNFISHHHKFRVNRNIKMFFLGWRKKEVGFTASRRSGLNCTRNLSSSACRLLQPLHEPSGLSGRVCSSVPAEADAAAALLTCRTCRGWESALIGGGAAAGPRTGLPLTLRMAEMLKTLPCSLLFANNGVCQTLMDVREQAEEAKREQKLIGGQAEGKAAGRRRS